MQEHALSCKLACTVAHQNELSKKDVVDKIIKHLRDRAVDVVTIEMFLQILARNRSKDLELEKQLWKLFDREPKGELAKISLKYLTQIGPTPQFLKSHPYQVLVSTLQDPKSDAARGLVYELSASTRAIDHLIKVGLGESIVDIGLSTEISDLDQIMLRWTLLTGPARGILTDERYRRESEHLFMRFSRICCGAGSCASR